MYSINYLSRNGQTGPTLMIDPMIHTKTDKVISPLGVARVIGGNDTNGTCSHAVVMLFMCLYILPKFYLVVCIEVKSSFHYKF